MLFGMPPEVQEALAASVPFPSRLRTPEDYAKLAKQIVEIAGAAVPRRPDQTGSAAICRRAFSKTSGGCPPEIRWRSLMITAGTEWMPCA